MNSRCVMACAALAFFLLLGGCGASIWTVTDKTADPGQIDGAVLSYALADGQVNLTASWTKATGALVITSDQKLTAAPDYKPLYRLVYDHSTLSDDEVEILFDGALVTSISSTTTDRSLDAVNNVTTLLAQVGTTKADVNKMKTVMYDIAPPKKALSAADCADMEATSVVNITHGRKKDIITKPGDPRCSIEFRIEITPPRPDQILGVSGFMPPSRAGETATCDHVFCFRRAGVFDVLARARLVEADNQHPLTKFTNYLSFQILAPDKDALGFIRFNRRAFVANKASIKFSNGLVTSFAATNPSEVVGFLQLPTNVLKGVSAAILIH